MATKGKTDAMRRAHAIRRYDTTEGAAGSGCVEGYCATGGGTSCNDNTGGSRCGIYQYDK